MWLARATTSIYSTTPATKVAQISDSTTILRCVMRSAVSIEELFILPSRVSVVGRASCQKGSKRPQRTRTNDAAPPPIAGTAIQLPPIALTRQQVKPLRLVPKVRSRMVEQYRERRFEGRRQGSVTSVRPRANFLERMCKWARLSKPAGAGAGLPAGIRQRLLRCWLVSI